MSRQCWMLHIVTPVFPILLHIRVFMLLSCIGQRSLSNSGVLEGLLTLLDSLLSPLQQPQAAAQRRTEGKAALITVAHLQMQSFPQLKFINLIFS